MIKKNTRVDKTSLSLIRKNKEPIKNKDKNLNVILIWILVVKSVNL